MACVTVGADDLPRARRFYAAQLLPHGYALEEGPEGPSFVLPAAPGAPPAPDFPAPDFCMGCLRNPQCNKIALLSAEPDEPGRDD
nr:hypothetical protein [Albimonas pacifica]